MTALTGKTPAATYKDLLQISNSNSGIDGTRRSIEDGEGTSAPFELSTSAAAFTGVLNTSAASLGMAADQVLMSYIDWSGDDTLTGNMDVASGSSLDFLSGSTLTLATGSSFTVPDDFIPMSDIDFSGDETLSGALTFTSASTFTTGSSLDVTASSLLLRDDQIALSKVDLSDDDTIEGALSVASGASLSFVSGATLTVDENATRNTFISNGELLDTSTGSSFNSSDLASITAPRRISVVFDSVSLSGSDNILVQLGDAGGIETTGYVSSSAPAGLGTGGVVSSTSGFIIRVAGASNILHGVITLNNVTGDTWVATFAGATTGGVSGGVVSGGTKTLSGTLTQVTVTRTGANSFDGGQIRVLIE